MSNLSDIGNLMHLYLDEISPGGGTNAPEFLIKAAAKALKELGNRNWIPAIVKKIGEDRYEIIGNSFIYAVAEAAGNEKVWCIIAESDEKAEKLTKILAGEKIPKISLSTATRDEIKAALEYLIEKPGSALKSVKLLVATNRIEEAPRQYWKTFDPIAALKCGITKGAKLNALKEVFELTPQPIPEIIKDPALLQTLNLTELRKQAKKREIPNSSKKPKAELILLLSQ
jgi:hypothetical protein